jgi:hypothetical protein
MWCGEGWRLWFAFVFGKTECHITMYYFCQTLPIVQNIRPETEWMLFSCTLLNTLYKQKSWLRRRKKMALRPRQQRWRCELEKYDNTIPQNIIFISCTNLPAFSLPSPPPSHHQLPPKAPCHFLSLSFFDNPPWPTKSGLEKKILLCLYTPHILTVAADQEKSIANLGCSLMWEPLGLSPRTFLWSLRLSGRLHLQDITIEGSILQMCRECWKQENGASDGEARLSRWQPKIWAAQTIIFNGWSLSCCSDGSIAFQC